MMLSSARWISSYAPRALVDLFCQSQQDVAVVVVVVRCGVLMLSFRLGDDDAA